MNKNSRFHNVKIVTNKVSSIPSLEIGPTQKHRITQNVGYRELEDSYVAYRDEDYAK